MDLSFRLDTFYESTEIVWDLASSYSGIFGGVIGDNPDGYPFCSVVSFSIYRKKFNNKTVLRKRSFKNAKNLKPILICL